MRIFALVFLLLPVCVNGQVDQSANHFDRTSDTSQLIINKLDLFDTTRNRSVPVLIYRSPKTTNFSGIVIINHGHQFKNSDYSFIAKSLVDLNYMVVSIQHELATDEPLTVHKADRKKIWQRGADNVLFVIRELTKNNSRASINNISLIGHSMGGDICMVFARQHPDEVSSVITLDHCRQPMPLVYRPKLYSLRSSDQLADSGLLPSIQEQQRYHIKIIEMRNTGHNDMSDYGTPAQQSEMTNLIKEFLGKR